MKLYQILKILKYSNIQIENHGLKLIFPISKPSSLLWEDYLKDKNNPLFKRDIDYVQPTNCNAVIVWLKSEKNKNV